MTYYRQPKLVERQARDLLQDKLKGRVAFCNCLPTEEFSNARYFASEYHFMFGTTYLYAQTFSRMKHIKNEPVGWQFEVFVNIRTSFSSQIFPICYEQKSNFTIHLHF